MKLFYPDTKTNKDYTRKRKLQINVLQIHIFKKNSSKPNSTSYIQDYTPQATGIYPGDSRLILYVKTK